MLMEKVKIKAIKNRVVNSLLLFGVFICLIACNKNNGLNLLQKKDYQAYFTFLPGKTNILHTSIFKSTITNGYTTKFSRIQEALSAVERVENKKIHEFCIHDTNEYERTNRCTDFFITVISNEVQRVEGTMKNPDSGRR